VLSALTDLGMDLKGRGCIRMADVGERSCVLIYEVVKMPNCQAPTNKQTTMTLEVSTCSTLSNTWTVSLQQMCSKQTEVNKCSFIVTNLLPHLWSLSQAQFAIPFSGQRIPSKQIASTA
jgi:hypothetical protein